MSAIVVNALDWIKGILEEQQIQYQIVGGLAASIHGGYRPVADIDLYIPKESVDKILPTVQDYISKPLTHCVEGSWDVEYFQLIYQAQKIEIGLSPGTKIINDNTGEWIELVTNYAQSVKGNYKGEEVPVIPVSQLIAYKTLLDREVDRIDISELTGASTP